MGLTLQNTLPAQSAGGADAVTVLGEVSNVGGADNQVQRAEIIPPAGYSTVTGIATNNATISVRQVRAGSVVATVATVTLSLGNNLVAETPLALTVTPTLLAQGDVLDVLMHQNGSGIAIGAGLIVEVEDNFAAR